MQTIQGRILRWLVRVSIVTLIAVAVVINAVWLAFSYLNQHPDQMSKLVTEALHEPVSIKHMSAGWHYFTPVFRFRNVVVQEPGSGLSVVAIQRLEVGVNVFESVIKQKLLPDRIFLSGAHLIFYSPKMTHFHFDQIRFGDLNHAQFKSSEVTSLIDWLLAEKHIDFNEVTVSIRNQQAKLYQLSHIKGKLRNNNKIHQLALDAIIKNGHPLHLHGVINAAGQHLNSLKGQLYCRIQGLRSADWLSHKTTLSANGNMAVWADFQAQQIQHAYAKFLLAKIRYQDHFINRASGTIDWFPRQSEWFVQSHLNLDEGHFALPSYYAHPIAFHHLASIVKWTHNPDYNHWQVQGLHWDDGNLQFTGHVDAHQKKQQLPMINMALQYSMNALKDLSDYLPDKQLAPSTFQWASQLFQSGSLQQGTLLWRGPVKSLPYRHHEGVVMMSAIMPDLAIQFSQQWPILYTDLTKMVINNGKVNLFAEKGRSAHNPLSDLHAIIDLSSQPELKFAAVSLTTLADALHYIHKTPMTLAHTLQTVSGQGQMKLAFALTFPLNQQGINHAQFRGDMQFYNAGLLLPSWSMDLKKLNGSLQFNEGVLTTNDLHGELLGQPFSLGLTTKQIHHRDRVIIVKANGQMNIDAIRQHYQLPLSRFFTGGTHYHAQLQWHADNPTEKNTLSFYSDLQGVSTVDLPKPFAKTQKDIKPFEIHISLKQHHPAFIRLQYADQVSSALVYHPTHSGLSLYSGQINVNAGTAQYRKDAGLVINANLPVVNETEWSHLFSKLLYNHPAANIQSSPSLLLKRIDCHINQFTLFKHQWRQVDVTVLPQSSVWRLNIRSPLASGFLFVPKDFKQRWEGHFTHLYVPQLDFRSSLHLDPKKLPAMTIAVQDFRYASHPYGQLLLDTAKLTDGLNLNTIRVQSPVQSIKMNGTWRDNGAHHSVTHLQGVVDTKDFGHILSYFYKSPMIQYGEGELQFSLNWQAPPYHFNDASLQGKINYHLKNGSFVKVGDKSELEIGIGRALNLLSITAIPRHLMMDFHDLTHKGVWFDHLDGGFNILRGIAVLEPTEMDGPIVTVLAKGQTSLTTHQYHMKFQVMPKLTASIPTVIGFIGGPIAGLVGWAADKLVGPEISKISAYTYQVTGSWKHPKIAKLKSSQWDYRAPVEHRI